MRTIVCILLVLTLTGCVSAKARVSADWQDVNHVQTSTAKIEIETTLY